MSRLKEFRLSSAALVPLVGCGLLALSMQYQSTGPQPLLTQAAPATDCFSQFPARCNPALLTMAQRQFQSYQAGLARERQTSSRLLRFRLHQTTRLNREKYNEVTEAADSSAFAHSTLPRHLSDVDD